MIRSTLLAMSMALLAAAASAHSKTDGTTPADGATVAEVPMLHMVFDAPMRVIAATLTEGGADVAIERGTGMEPTLEFHAVPAAPLSPGTYRLDWRGMAEDGHPMQGGFGFTVSE
ncbi:copper resistance protein CopC [Jannaschia sp. Os4]|uniref:copper resistance CopC family protein n=1 Tax=Jannaschia sp. Os4 TaxID=2807617 RepID=UPI00193AAF6E|nr:copper resistance CopC family protein [Jannaschia sp. Os4]MBM2578150.1 copper resistance protein CopC [Jannaschia sp. Os4]